MMKQMVLLSLLSMAFALAAAPNPAKVAEVKAGKVTEAQASWWGFDKLDSTEFLQAALSSGVKKLVVDYTGSDWIVNRTLNLPSNIEIVVSDKVVVRAKKDCFKRLGDALFRGAAVKNVKIRGEGSAKLAMIKADYLDPKKYQLGEWRHGLNLGGVDNFTVENITIASSGGDGIYLGSYYRDPCRNVTVRNVVFDDHNRLGMAVISAENLLIERCRFINTKGASPAGGIDFEPNRPIEKLVNCVLRDSFFENCHGAAISISPNHLNVDSTPVSITVSNCKANNNGLGLFLYPTRRSKLAPVKGTVLIENCQFLNSSNTLQDPIENSVKFQIKNCTFTAKGDATPFDIRCNEAEGRKLGGLFFDNVQVQCAAKTAPFNIAYLGAGDISSDIRGTVTVNGKPFALDKFVAERQRYFQLINSLEPAAAIDLSKLHLPEKAANAPADNQCYLRGRFTYVQYAKKGENITIDTRAVSGGYPAPLGLDLLSPAGKKLKHYEVALNGKIHPVTFTATETGYYQVVGQTVQRADLSSKHPGGAILLDKSARTLLPLGGRAYFEVPIGVKEFHIGVSSDAGADISLVDAANKVVQHNADVRSMTVFKGTRTDASRPEIWSIQVNRATWQVYFRLYKPLVPLFGFNPATLPTVSERTKLVIPPIADRKESTILNGGFEQLRNGSPLYWQKPNAPKSVMELGSNNPAEGVYVLKVRTPEGLSLMSFSNVEVKPGQKFRVALKVRGKGRISVEASQYNAEKRWIRPNATLADRKIDQADFTTIEGVYTASNSAASFRVVLNLTQGSELELDDCTVDPVK